MLAFCSKRSTLRASRTDLRDRLETLRRLFGVSAHGMGVRPHPSLAMSRSRHNPGNGPGPASQADGFPSLVRPRQSREVSRGGQSGGVRERPEARNEAR